MSVWKAACYRDDALQRVASLVRPAFLDDPFIVSLCDFTVEEHGDFPLPPGIHAGNLAKQVKGHPDLVESIIDRPTKRRVDPNDEVIPRTFKHFGRAKFGIHGVYDFIAKHWSTFTAVKEIPVGQKRLFEALYAFGYATSLRTRKEATLKTAHAFKVLQETVTAPYAAIRELIRIATFAGNKKYKADLAYNRLKGEDLPILDCKPEAWLRSYDIRWYKGILFLTVKLTKETYVFLKEDISRIEKMVMGLAWCRYYAREYSDNDETLNKRLGEAVDKLMVLIEHSLRKVTKDGANSLCRAYDVALWSYIASLSTDVDRRAADQQAAKIDKERLGEFVDLYAIRKIVEPFKIKEALEILQVYKAFPQPDFDYFGAAHRQSILYGNERIYGKAAETDETGTVEDLTNYFKFTLVRAFHKKHGFCPGSVTKHDSDWHRSYPHISPEKIPLEAVGDIDMKNTFTYDAHGTDILEMVKDKAIIPVDTIALTRAAELNSVPIERKNQLMDVLTRNDPVDMLDLISRADSLNYSVKAEDKPEAKKPNGRWFFEAATDARLVRSEYEASVANYAVHTTGCMAGKSTKDKIATMNYICSLPHAGTELFTLPFFISFDLDKFSPSLRSETHKVTDTILAECFGMPHLANASRDFDEGSIHYIKRRIHHVIPKAGRDFEGFAGRKNTIYHCAVMGYCVRRLRKLGLVEAGGRFASLIDDGLLRLELDVDTYQEKAEKIKQIVEDIYRMANLYISWDKTFVSQHFAVFLNEFYYDGTPITPGIRSFLKINNRSDHFCPTICDDIAMLESTCRGAIAAGAPPGTVYGAYAFHLLDSVNKWGKLEVKNAIRLGLVMFTPIALGGFGCNGVAALSGSMTTDPFTEGISNLRAIAVRFKPLAPLINKIVNVTMRQMSDRERFTSPISARREGRTLKVTRAKAVIERRLYSMIDTPVIRALLGDVSSRSEDSAHSLFAGYVRVPIEVVASIQESSLDSAIANVANKFLRARTASRLVPTRAFFRASIANVTEARALFHEWNN